MASRRGKGEGSIRRRKDGLWEASVTIGKTATGNPKCRSIYGKTRKEVAKKLAELLDQQNKGLLLEPSRLTVAEAVNRWVDNKTNISNGTQYKYQRETASLLDLIGHLRLQGLRAHHVRTAYTNLAKQGASVRAQKKAAGHLRAAMREAMHDGLTTRNFADGIRISTPRVQKAAQAWTPTEVTAFLEAARNDPLYSVFYLMLTLGLRRGEVLGLPWDRVDFTAGTIRINQALVLQGKGNTPAICEVKTPNSRRVLHMSQDVLEVLENHRRYQGEQHAFMGTDWHHTGLVFTTTIGTPIHPRNALRSFKRLVTGADITPIRLHDLRHTHASLALQKGIPVEVVSERLGHARVDITLNTYRHLYEAERQQAALQRVAQ